MMVSNFVKLVNAVMGEGFTKELKEPTNKYDEAAFKMFREDIIKDLNEGYLMSSSGVLIGQKHFKEIKRRIKDMWKQRPLCLRKGKNEQSKI